MGIERIYLNIIKATYDKPTVYIIFKGEKLEAFPLKSGTKDFPGSPVVKTSRFQCKGHRFHHVQGTKIPHTAQQDSGCGNQTNKEKL